MGEKQAEQAYSIQDREIVTVTTMNHLTELQYMKKMNQKATIKKISKDEYVNLQTGELKEFAHTENRKESYNSLRQTFKKIRYLINNNFVGGSNELFITLTYREDVQDLKRVYSDYKRYMRKLEKYCKKMGLGTFDSLKVVEPTEKGRWHIHQLLRFNDVNKVYIPNKFDGSGNVVDAPLFEMWAEGFVTIKSMEGVDNIGAYLSAYLSDIELSDDNQDLAYREECEVVEKEIDGKKKKFIKGGRLHMYPSGANLFSKTKGIVYPERKRMSYKNAKKIVGSAKPHYSKTYDIESDGFSNTVVFEQYNSKRL